MAKAEASEAPSQGAGSRQYCQPHFHRWHVESRHQRPPPGIYLPPLIEKVDEEPFHSQYIPIDGQLLEVERYRRFLVERWKRIAERLNSFLVSWGLIIRLDGMQEPREHPMMPSALPGERGHALRIECRCNIAK
jgi:hypothetical protein